MSSDEFCEMNRSDREKWLWEQNFKFHQPPDLSVEEKATPPTEAEDLEFQLQRREAGAGRHNPNED